MGAEVWRELETTVTCLQEDSKMAKKTDRFRTKIFGLEPRFSAETALIPLCGPIVPSSLSQERLLQHRQ
jgi:hypothetical protein